MTFSFLMYLLYHKFLKKSIKKLVFHQVEFNHNSCYIYLIGESSRKPIARISRHIYGIFIQAAQSVKLHLVTYKRSEGQLCSTISPNTPQLSSAST